MTCVRFPGVCSDCINGPAPDFAEFNESLTVNSQAQGTCPWECSEGFVRSGGRCDCESGRYFNGLQCVLCITCTPGTYPTPACQASTLNMLNMSCLIWIHIGILIRVHMYITRTCICIHITTAPAVCCPTYLCIHILIFVRMYITKTHTYVYKCICIYMYMYVHVYKYTYVHI